MVSDRIEHRARRACVGLRVSGCRVAGRVPQGRAAAIASTWRTHDIHIDGVNTEWASLDELQNGPAVAFANDDKFLYVIVAASDQQMRRLIATGVILWFDPTGGKKETFAIGLLGSDERHAGRPGRQRRAARHGRSVGCGADGSVRRLRSRQERTAPRADGSRVRHRDGIERSGRARSCTSSNCR